MGAALLAHRSGGAVVTRSAGSALVGKLDPVAIQALREISVDPTGAHPKPLTDEVVRAADAVVTMACGDACPIYPGRRYLDRHLPDPEGQSIDRSPRHPRPDRRTRARPAHRAHARPAA
jgi:arsenate reductase